jgi:hypothetical protein
MNELAEVIRQCALPGVNYIWSALTDLA